MSNMSFYSEDDLKPSGFHGRDFEVLADDPSFFVLDMDEESQVQLWPPRSMDDELPNFLYGILVNEMERRKLPPPVRLVEEQ